MADDLGWSAGFGRGAIAVLFGLAAAAVAAAPFATAGAGEPPPGSNAGPPYDFTTEIMDSDALEYGLRDKAMLTKTDLGYRFRAGNQDSRLVMTVVDAGLRVADTGTESFIELPASCKPATVQVGIAAVCPIPAGITRDLPLLIEVWPRLGDDYTDSSALPATFAVAVLGDAGHDVARFGAGRDYFNGFSGRDVVWGGAENDWIRAGSDNDEVNGGAGSDDIVAVQGNDTLRGRDGLDRIWGGDGDDQIWGGPGADVLQCGNGNDSATVDAGDRIARSCESIATG